jgi:hypothetical protein
MLSHSSARNIVNVPNTAVSGHSPVRPQCLNETAILATWQPSITLKGDTNSYRGAIFFFVGTLVSDEMDVVKIILHVLLA